MEAKQKMLSEINKQNMIDTLLQEERCIKINIRDKPLVKKLS
jgi:hypothetical protein